MTLIYKHKSPEFLLPKGTTRIFPSFDFIFRIGGRNIYDDGPAGKSAATGRDK